LSIEEIVRLLKSDEQLNYSAFRARRIARTEVMRASNIGAMKGAEAHDFEVDKQWISARDSRTRRIPKDTYDHVALDGVIVGYDEPFESVGKEGQQVSAMQPGDITTPAGFTINCRCAIGFIPKRDSDGRLVLKPNINAPTISRTSQAIKLPEKINLTTQKYSPKKTIKEAEQWAKENLNIKFVSFKGIDLGIANDINESVYNMKQIMPNIRTNGIGSAQAANKAMKLKISDEIKNSRGYTELVKNYGEKAAEKYLNSQINKNVPKVSNGTLAWSANRGTVKILGKEVDVSDFVGVFVNEKEAKSKELMDKVIRSNRDVKWFTESADNFGYVMQHELGHEIDKTIKFRSTDIFNAFYNKEHSMGIQSVANRLSRYGATGNGKSIDSRKAEMIAEAWAEYMTSKNPRQLSKELSELMLKSYYEKNNIDIPFNTWINEITKIIRK